MRSYRASLIGPLMFGPVGPAPAPASATMLLRSVNGKPVVDALPLCRFAPRTALLPSIVVLRMVAVPNANSTPPPVVTPLPDTLLPEIVLLMMTSVLPAKASVPFA
jgi:hypothetical protein